MFWESKTKILTLQLLITQGTEYEKKNWKR